MLGIPKSTQEVPGILQEQAVLGTTLESQKLPVSKVPGKKWEVSGKSWKEIPGLPTGRKSPIAELPHNAEQRSTSELPSYSVILKAGLLSSPQIPSYCRSCAIMS